MGKNKEWFSDWFDSSFYHILYVQRDEKEAQFFFRNLLQRLSPAPLSTMLDLACGKGRHSIYLNSKGYDVTGMDLSAESIAHASQFGNDHLRFKVHDMRDALPEHQFEYVFNLFTSFGYFDDKQDNLKVLQSVATTLKPGGMFVLDFLNACQTIDHLVSEEVKTVQNIEFHIRRSVQDGFIVKDIEFEHDGHSYAFQEKVQALDLSDFQKLFNATELQIIDTFGDYALQPYDSNKSSRLILLAQKQ